MPDQPELVRSARDAARLTHAALMAEQVDGILTELLTEITTTAQRGGRSLVNRVIPARARVAVVDYLRREGFAVSLVGGSSNSPKAKLNIVWPDDPELVDA